MWIPLSAAGTLVVVAAIGFGVWWLVIRTPDAPIGGVGTPVPVGPTSVTAAINPPPGVGGWINADVVQLTFTTTSPDVTTIAYSTSGALTLAKQSVKPSSAGVSLVGAGAPTTPEGTTTVVYHATKLNSDERDQTITVNVDRTPVSLSATILPQPNPAGWSKEDVSIAFTCSAGPAGIDECPTQQILKEGVHPGFLAVARNRTGNSGSFPIPEIRVDETPPTSAITPPAAKPGFPTLTGTASDPGSTASGLKAVELSLYNANAKSFWSGVGYQPNEVFLTMDGKEAWTYTAKKPPETFAQFKACSRATDVAGNQQAAACTTFNVSPGPTPVPCKALACATIEVDPRLPQLIDGGR